MVLKRLGRERRPLLLQAVDKLAARELAGSLSSSICLPTLYQVADKASELDEAHWPEEFVIKPSHGSGAVVLVTKQPRPGVSYEAEFERFQWSKGTWGILSSDLDAEKLKSLAQQWLSSDFSYYKPKNPEWAYGQIGRRIIVEELLSSGEAGHPVELRFHCFHGRVLIVRITESWNSKRVNWTLDRSGFKLKAGLSYDKPQDISELKLPTGFFDAVLEAEKLSKNWDYIRVDLYATDNGIFFSEYTPYPNGGLVDFTPFTLSRLLAKAWKTGNFEEALSEIKSLRT
jgi:hypothetical protein